MKACRRRSAACCSVLSPMPSGGVRRRASTWGLRSNVRVTRPWSSTATAPSNRMGSKRTVPHRCNLALGRAPGSPNGGTPTPSGLDAGGGSATPPTERKPTRFTSAVIVSPERPARDIHQIVEAIIEQLTALPGSRVKIRLEIDTEVPEGLERSKVRTLVENAADRDVWFRCCGR